MSLFEIDKLRPLWFRLPVHLRMLWLLWFFVSAPFRRRFTANPEKLHAVLVVRDLFSTLSALIHAFHAEGIPHSKIIILDSGSTAPRCLAELKYLASLGCQIIKISRSSLAFGPYVIWKDKTLPLPQDFWAHPFLLTDPDLDLKGLPRGWLSILTRELNLHRWACKIGLGLRTDDLSSESAAEVAQWEEQLSNRFPYGILNKLIQPIGVPSRICPTDTTLALYRPLRHFTTLAIRLEGAFRIRHLPWYSSFLQTEEYSYYQQHKEAGIGKWSTG